MPNSVSSNSSSGNSVLLSVHPEQLHLVAGVSEDIPLQINNVSFKPIMFRLLTTAPHRYIVKPHKGVILPSTTQIVSITLSEGVVDPCFDDFRLEYTAVFDSDAVGRNFSNVPDILKSRPRDMVVKKTLKCSVTLPTVPSDRTKVVSESPKKKKAEEAERKVVVESDANLAKPAAVEAAPVVNDGKEAQDALPSASSVKEVAEPSKAPAIVSTTDSTVLSSNKNNNKQTEGGAALVVQADDTSFYLKVAFLLAILAVLWKFVL